MRCKACNHLNRDGARFCVECGERLAQRCPACGAELAGGAKFCDQCGAPLDSPDETKPSAAKAQPADRVREGERRTVTVLFADAVGHTEISEKVGEEAAYTLIQGCFDRMQAAVEKFGGTVNQFTGDGILALFGAPIAHEDSGRRAVAAALQMQSRLSQYAEQVHAKHSIHCAFRIGLNTGPVVIGRISETLDLELAAVGDTVNLAALARAYTLADRRDPAGQALADIKTARSWEPARRPSRRR